MARRRKVHTTKGGMVVRSNFEVDCIHALERNGVQFQYEGLKFPYVTHHNYHPDLELGNGIVVELKGLFRPADRAKILAVRRAHPNLDLRMVFMNASVKISKRSKTTYAAWCDQHGIIWDEKRVPIEWSKET